MKKRFESFTFNIFKLYKLVQKIKLFEMKDYELKAVHVMCIYYLSEYGKMTATELTRHTLEDKAAISRTLKQLAEYGYVAYDADSYNSPIELTERGDAIAKAIQEKAERAVDAAGGTLTEEQRAGFYDCLGVITERLDEYYKGLLHEGSPS